MLLSLFLLLPPTVTVLVRLTDSLSHLVALCTRQPLCQHSVIVPHGTDLPSDGAEAFLYQVTSSWGRAISVRTLNLCLHHPNWLPDESTVIMFL